MSFGQQPYNFQPEFQQQQQQMYQQQQGLPSQQPQQPQLQSFPQGMTNPYQGVQLQQQAQAPSPHVAQQMAAAQRQYPGGGYRNQFGVPGGASGFNQKYQQQAVAKPQYQQQMNPQQYAAQARMQQQQQQQQPQQQQVAPPQYQQPQHAQQPTLPPGQHGSFQQPHSRQGYQPASPQVTNLSGPVKSAPLSSNTPHAEYSSADKVLDALDKLDEATSKDEVNLVDYMKKDVIYDRALKKQAAREGSLVHKKQVELDYYTQARMYRQSQVAVIFGEGYQGYGNGWTNNKAILQYPNDRKRAKRRAREYLVPNYRMQELADQQEILCPVRLDFEVDKFRLRDTFTWNTTEKDLSIELFVDHLLEDFGMPPAYQPPLTKMIREQLEEFHPHAFTKIDPDSYNKDEDMRINIKLDITVGQHNLVDQFEWDMNCEENSPEQFAEQMCKELSLSGEFVTAIAHAIREQTQLHTRSLFLTGYSFDGSTIEEDDIRREIQRTVNPDDVFRPKTQIKDYTPILIEIPDVELDRQDKDRDRDSRRKRRQGRAGRRGGPTLPDLRESVRTFRTPVYSSILPGGVDKNMEIVRKNLTIENSDDDEDDEFSYGSGSGISRRGRRAAHAAQAAISGQIQYNNNPHSTIKFNSPGRPPLHRVAMQNAVTSGAVSQSPQPTPPHSMRRSTPLSDSPDDVIGSYMVTLRVPNLRQIMMARNYRP